MRIIVTRNSFRETKRSADSILSVLRLIMIRNKFRVTDVRSEFRVTLNRSTSNAYSLMAYVP